MIAILTQSLGFLFRSRITDGFDGGAGNQASRNHLVQVGNQFLNLVFGVNDAHHDGRVFRERQAAGVIDPGAGPEAFETAIDSRARKPKLLALCNDRLMQWLALPLVCFRKVNAQHPGLKFFFHGLPLVFARFSCAMGILDNVHVRKHYQALLDHLVHNGQKSPQLLFGVND
jgi:hypothetical protein